MAERKKKTVPPFRETLIRIANKYKIPDYHKIIEWNPHIDPKTNMIRAGEYLWIKQ